MLTIENVVENHTKKRRDNELIRAEDRLSRRLVKFLTEDQMKELGMELKDEFKGKHKPIPFTAESVLEQLRNDVSFGYEKCTNHRGKSSALMFDVVLDWCKILENELAGWDENNYAPYGYPLFKAVNDLYGWDVVGEKPSVDEV